MKRVLGIVLGVIALIIALAFAFGYDYLFTAVRMTYLRGKTKPGILDGALFPKSPVASGTAIPWEEASGYNQTPLSPALSAHLKSYKTTSFLVIKNNKIISENYWNGFNRTTRSNSFSMAKTVTVMLTGFALQDKKIQSLDQKLSDYYSGFKEDKNASQCTLEDLADMESGLNWVENYMNPFRPNAKAYYGNNLARLMLNRNFNDKPGTIFKYQSGSTQLLGFAIRKAVGIPLGSYLSEKLWIPLGMEYPAYWSLDHEGGMEKAFCCINATGRDFAKLGQLFLNNGSFGGKQILNREFIHQMETGTHLSNDSYGLGLWINNDSEVKYYYFQGLYGQYIICIPQYQMILVRTGPAREEDLDSKGRPKEVDFFVKEAVKTFADLN